MKKVCSSCGETFEGVVCPNCSGGRSVSRDRTNIITVSKPVFEEEPSAPAPSSEHTLKVLEKRQKKAQRAEAQVHRLEKKEDRRNRRAAKREHRLVQSEQSDSKASKIVTQFRHALSLSITGATRQAIHFVISPRGSLAFLLLIPLCALIPIIVAVTCEIYSGIETSPDFLKAVGEVISASAPAMLKGLLFWLELCGALVLYLRAHSFAIGSAMTFRRAVGLVCIAQLPGLFLMPLFAVCLFIVPALSLLLAVLAVFQFIIMVFIGVEFAAMDKKRGVFTSFSIMLAIYICTVAALASVNFPAAADYVTSLVTNIKL